MALPLMPKATAVWLVENTTLSFDQIADFCGMHMLEIQGIADGEVAQNIVGKDPVAANQLTQDELDRCQGDPKATLQLKEAPVEIQRRATKGARYTPVSKRQDRPAAIAWLLRNHPELADSQVQKLLGTTKDTINKIRDRTHWNIANIKPQDPVSLGICTQTELVAAVEKAADRRRKALAANPEFADIPEPVAEFPAETEDRMSEHGAIAAAAFGLTRSPSTDTDPNEPTIESVFGPASSSDEEDEEESKQD